MAKDQKQINRDDPDYWDQRARSYKSKWERKAFKSPDQLWQLACQYFKRIDERPFLKQDFIKGGEMAGSTVELKTIRPYTWSGLTDYLFERGFISTLQDYKSNREGKYNDYVEVIHAIEQVMYTQKFEGAAVGAFNANIISRDLGLIDKSAQTVTVEQPLFGDDDSDEDQ